MGRVVTALQVLDAGCDPNTLELVTRKAKILIELHTEVGDSDRKKAVRFLRDKFTAYVLDEGMAPKEKDISIGALGEIIQQLGRYPSASPHKVFSTPSDSKGKAGGGDPLQRDAGRDLSGVDDVGLRSKIAAMEMELEALKADKAEGGAASDAGGSVDSLGRLGSPPGANQGA